MSGRSVHTIKAEVEVRVIPAGLADFERIYPTLEIEFSYLPGAPDTYDAARGGPGGWDPGWPPEVGYLGVRLIDGDGLEPLADDVKSWAQDWLDRDEGYRIACAHAEKERRFPSECP